MVKDYIFKTIEDEFWMKAIIFVIVFIFIYESSAFGCGLLKIPRPDGGLNTIIRVDKISSIQRVGKYLVSINNGENVIKFFKSDAISRAADSRFISLL